MPSFAWGRDPGDEIDEHEAVSWEQHDQQLLDAYNAGYSTWTFRGITTTFRPSGVTVTTEPPAFDPLRPWLAKPAHQDNDSSMRSNLSDDLKELLSEVSELEKDAAFMDRILRGAALTEAQEAAEKRKKPR